MIIALGIVGGFRKELTSKIAGFAGDVKLTERSAENPTLITPYIINPADIRRLSSIDGVNRAQAYATVQGLLQTKNGVEGVVLKGVAKDYNWDFLSRNLVGGEIPHFTDSTRSREVIISSLIARKMGLTTGDIFRFIVINEEPRCDRFRVSGIYESGLEEFDSKIIFGDIQTVCRINNWESGSVEGYEFYTTGGDAVAEAIFDELPDGKWNLDTISESYVQFFDWIEMIEVNTSFVLIIMLIVAVINMLSGVLVIVLESVRMVGILKTQGMTFGSLQRIFIYRSGYIVLWGLFWGNLAGLSLCAAQYYFELLTLDATVYFMSGVPIWLSVKELLLINLGSFVIITLLMVIPTMIVERITPAESIKYN